MFCSVLVLSLFSSLVTPMPHHVQKRMTGMSQGHIHSHLNQLQTNVLNKITSHDNSQLTRLNSVRQSLIDRLSGIQTKLGKLEENNPAKRVSAKMDKLLELWDAHFCPSGFLKHNTSCYLLVDQPKTRDDAESHCGMFGAHLLTVESEVELEFLMQMVADSKSDSRLVITDGVWKPELRYWTWQYTREFAPSVIFPQTPAGTSHPIRLIGGSGPHEGRVEIFARGSWGIVCDDEWDLNDAKVVCRQLGFEGAVKVLSNSHFGYGNGRHRMDDVACSGSEASLDKCRHLGWDRHNCGNSEAAGVVCKARVSHPVRLVGGGGPNEGRVEIFDDGRWGIVCDDYWDMRDASVVCRQLGYPGAVMATSRSRFGHGNGQHKLDDVGCSGTEATLDQCSHIGWNNHNCNDRESAGVVCKTPKKKEKNRIRVRLVDGRTPNEGRVEIFNAEHGGWGIVCDDVWTLKEANVVCRQLGFTDAQDATKYSLFGYGNGQFRLDGIGCSGSESALHECPHADWNKHDCRNDEAAGVICKGHNWPLPEDDTSRCLAMDGRTGYFYPYACQQNSHFICKI